MVRLRNGSTIDARATAAIGVRVVIADDHPLFAKTLEAMLAGEAGIEVVGTAENGLEALRLTRALEPDIVLMDLDMPVVDGLEATRRLLELGLPTHVLVLTGSLRSEDADLAFEAGAAGYLTKDRIATELVPAIRAVASGMADADATLTRDGGVEHARRARL